jgi:hypothetical protein
MNKEKTPEMKKGEKLKQYVKMIVEKEKLNVKYNSTFISTGTS